MPIFFRHPTIEVRLGQRWITIVCFVLACCLTQAHADDLSVSALKRGVSLSNWFSDAAREPLAESDFQTIKKAGFDHVRIPVNPEFWGFALSEAATGRVLFDFSKLDDAVNMARDNGLLVIFDIAAEDGIMAQLEQDPKAAIGFINLWRHIAEHYKLYAPDRLAFELLSEPGYAADQTKYKNMIADIVSAVRQETPKITIIVDVPKGAALEGFEGLTPVQDENTYYAFHFYEPYIVTHQGLKAAPAHGRALRYFHNLPYPSSAVKPAADYAPNASDVIEAKTEISDYVAADWDAAHIAARINLAADWAKANHAHVICTEFGIVRNTADPAVRYRWIEDVRKALEANGIGWDLWDYTDMFGITKLTGDTTVDPRDHLVRLADPDNGSRDIEPEAIKALFGG